MARVSCVFLDVGNVILVDYPSVAFYYWELARAIAQPTDVTDFYRRLLHEREEMVRNGPTGSPWAELGKRHLGEERFRAFRKEHEVRYRARYDELTPFVPGTRELIEELGGRVKLGLIANQPQQCAERLKRRGLWDLFAVHGISETVGMSKPDPAFFLWACQQAGVSPEKCLMVGDRLDNDVAPAKRVGMTAIWLDWCNARDVGVPPSHEYERLYLKSIGRAYFGDWATDGGAPVESDYMVHSVAELDAVLHRLLS